MPVPITYRDDRSPRLPQVATLTVESDRKVVSSMSATKQWSITVDIDEQEDSTLAHVSLSTPTGHEVTGIGEAQRNPHDPRVPEIGDELAVARALRNLAERLLHTTEKDITNVTGTPAHVHR
jgi:hypothetical protein